MTRWFITGGGGQLATEFVSRLEGEVFVAREEYLDIRDANAVRIALGGFAPDIVLHTAAYTNVDGAERDEETAFAVNALGTRNIVEALRGTRAQLIAFSTDYVFDGRKGTPYVESDQPNPINAYGRTKLAGEREALAWSRSTVVRTAWLYSVTGTNFVKTILNAARERARARSREPLRVVADQVGSPTAAADLAEAVQEAVQQGLGPGIFHLAGSGTCSWYELAREIVAWADLPVEVVPITTAEAGRPAPRPAFSALTSERDLPRLPDWRESLHVVVDQLLGDET